MLERFNDCDLSFATIYEKHLTKLEATSLEKKLIKLHKPKFNRRGKENPKPVVRVLDGLTEEEKLEFFRTCGKRGGSIGGRPKGSKDKAQRKPGSGRPKGSKDKVQRKSRRK